ncbi:adenylate/guanylate cyclase domain-containing protein [Streptomyces sp. LP05-1]|uniref:Adenylate/guanylate cyclase domain-containing protein n=1 Tax=Streptomyces pyxinae TaxID=2970734 RepID=A0ABT2CEB2_9ACTN|nr:adenylate/guanylate cyclase domain-containing protein [Streptomyces sp. LP05-1]MCS0635742.1 adenylate/guanylate cyclase domain-containing protein [Streptomyces sp. LP05-1]
MSAAEAADPLGADALRRAIEEVLLGGGRAWTRREIAERSGVALDRTVQIWRALGFPEAEDGDRVFTDADVEALRAGERLIEAGLITEESETMMARALGHHLSRLAEWQVDTLWAWLRRDAGTLADGDELIVRAAGLLPEMELMQQHVWRRHLAAYAGRALTEAAGEQAAGPGNEAPPSVAYGSRSAATADEGAAPSAGAPAPSPEWGDVRDRAVGFTDMVGYTRLSRGLDGAELGRVIDRFESLTGGVVADGRGRVVKTIGDEIFFVCDAASDAADIALEIIARAGREAGLPQLRTGLAHGPVLSRFGDLFGPAVNVAARLTALARPDTVLVDTVFAGELAGRSGYELRALRPVPVRGYSRLRPVSLRRANGDAGRRARA